MPLKVTDLAEEPTLNLTRMIDIVFLLMIFFMNSGEVSIRDQVLSMPALEQRLTRARENYPDQAVIVRGSGPDPYQHVMDVLAACHEAGIRHISLASRLQEES